MKVPRLLENKYCNDDSDDEPTLPLLTGHEAYPAAPDPLLDPAEKPKADKSAASADTMQLDSAEIKVRLLYPR